MASSRSYRALLEQSARRGRSLGLSATFVLLAAGAGILLREDQPQRSATPPGIPAPQGRVQVEVLNGTGRQGAARTATRILRHKGLDVVFLGNADSMADSTRVIVRRGDPHRASYVAAALGLGKVVVQIDTFRRVDVSVVLGDDFRPRLELHP